MSRLSWSSANSDMDEESCVSVKEYASSTSRKVKQIWDSVTDSDSDEVENTVRNETISELPSGEVERFASSEDPFPSEGGSKVLSKLSKSERLAEKTFGKRWTGPNQTLSSDSEEEYSESSSDDANTNEAASGKSVAKNKIKYPEHFESKASSTLDSKKKSTKTKRLQNKVRQLVTDGKNPTASNSTKQCSVPVPFRRVAGDQCDERLRTAAQLAKKETFFERKPMRAYCRNIETNWEWGNGFMNLEVLDWKFSFYKSKWENYSLRPGKSIEIVVPLIPSQVLFGCIQEEAINISQDDMDEVRSGKNLREEYPDQTSEIRAKIKLVPEQDPTAGRWKARKKKHLESMPRLQRVTGSDFRREKNKQKRKGGRVSKIDTTVKSIRYDS